MQIPVLDMDMVRFGFLSKNISTCSKMPPMNARAFYDMQPLHSKEKQHIRKLERFRSFIVHHVFPSRSLDDYFHPQLEYGILQELNLDQVLSRFVFYRFHDPRLIYSNRLISRFGRQNLSRAVRTGWFVIGARWRAFLRRVSGWYQNVIHFDANSDTDTDVEQQEAWATEPRPLISGYCQNVPRNSEDSQTTSSISDGPVFPEMSCKVPRQQILVVSQLWLWKIDSECSSSQMMQSPRTQLE